MTAQQALRIAARAQRLTLSHRYLANHSYTVRLQDGTLVPAWASGIKNQFATVQGKIGESWMTLGKWSWEALRNAPETNSPLTC